MRALWIAVAFVTGGVFVGGHQTERYVIHLRLRAATVPGHFPRRLFSRDTTLLTACSHDALPLGCESPSRSSGVLC